MPEFIKEPDFFYEDYFIEEGEEEGYFKDYDDYDGGE